MTIHLDLDLLKQLAGGLAILVVGFVLGAGWAALRIGGGR